MRLAGKGKGGGDRTVLEDFTMNRQAHYNRACLGSLPVVMTSAMRGWRVVERWMLWNAEDGSEEGNVFRTARIL